MPWRRGKQVGRALEISMIDAQSQWEVFLERAWLWCEAIIFTRVWTESQIFISSISPSHSFSPLPSFYRPYFFFSFWIILLNSSFCYTDVLSRRLYGTWRTTKDSGRLSHNWSEDTSSSVCTLRLMLNLLNMACSTLIEIWFTIFTCSNFSM